MVKTRLCNRVSTGPRGPRSMHVRADPLPCGRGVDALTHQHVRAGAGPHGSADAEKRPSRRGFREEVGFRISSIKGGTLLLFPHFQPIPIE
jgi:hypothetical protein